ncbi:hypothetical protein JOC37_000983 [Desulfohalotomaculum tongense]|uniref:hypothetical protein n=1 Tax=Desulforadius tongensis TaxID=1216062 RepID=UPI00195878CB|nr:hypothetical protein [Desulforadius tongensis]MBM7854610.1 hypothetical protein [Desulforadius tongensis]
MNKATGVILLIGLLIVGIALYGMRTVSASQISPNLEVYRYTDVLPIQHDVTSAEWSNSDKQKKLKTDQGQKAVNVPPNSAVPLYPSYMARPGAAGKESANSGAGKTKQQITVNSASPPYYGYWDQDGCW